MEFLIPLVLWALIWGALTAWLADQKGRDPLVWFILGSLFALFAIIVVGLSPNTERAPAPVRPATTSPAFAPALATSSPRVATPVPATKKCPDCAETVLAEARICRFCRYEFPTPPPPEIRDDASRDDPASVVPRTYGRWVLDKRAPNFAPGAQISLSTKGTTITLASDEFTRLLGIEKAAAAEWQGCLRLTDGRVEWLLRPLDGQDPVDVADALHRQGASGAAA